VKTKQRDKLEIDVGDRNQDYAYSDFLNAVNEVVCYFQNNRDGGLKWDAIYS